MRCARFASHLWWYLMRPAHLALALLVLSPGCSKPTEVTVLHAASLRRVMADAAAEYQKANPKVRIRLEPSGSQVAIRKVSEQGLRADLVAVADAQLIDTMMFPGHASWSLEFATNEVVLAHGQHSQYTAELRAENWPEVLTRPGVRLGRVNPDSAPLGYHTLFVWQLAEKHGGFGDAGKDLAARLLQAVPKAHLGADETELLGFLEAKAVDYAFLYRSTAEDHHLKFLELPPELNLAKPELAAKYAEASAEVRMKSGPTVLKGHPITYGITIPKGSASPDEATNFLAFLLGPRGRRLQQAAGFRPLERAVARGSGVPAALQD